MDMISNIFGGGQKQDDSAARIAEANAQTQREEQARMEQRYQQEQARIAADKAAEAQRLSQEEAKRQMDIEAARVENAKQQEAQKATGTGVSFADTRSDAAKALAASQAGGIQLPGYQQLSKFAQTTPGGYQGQQNAILNPVIASPTGFNSQKVGGRKYV